MSNKTKTTTRKPDAKPALTPKLRFPEFRDAGEWAIVPMGSLLARDPEYGVNAPAVPYSKDLPTYLRITDIGDDGHFLPESKVSVDIVATDSNYLELGDIVLARTGASVGKSYRYRTEDGRLVFAGFLIRIKPEPKKVNPIFLANFLTTQQYWSWVGVTSARSGQPGINGTEYSSLPVPVPSSASDDNGLLEQKRIAECLSTLDELIAAQAGKVDALKTHKKGLMQQLFPRKGETQPRLRFPEFQKAGEWKVKSLGEIFPITSSKRVHESDWTPTGVPFYRAREIVALNKQEPIQPLFISEELYRAYSKLTGEICAGHLLVTGVGSIGVPYLVRKGDRFYFKDGNIIWLKNDGNELSGEFLHRLYETDYVQQQVKTMADVGTVATYTIDNAKRTVAVFPPDKVEQQRIADCLTSLDHLIASQTQKLDALKTHKKGLMQQLFPTPEEVEA